MRGHTWNECDWDAWCNIPEESIKVLYWEKRDGRPGGVLCWEKRTRDMVAVTAAAKGTGAQLSAKEHITGESGGSSGCPAHGCLLGQAIQPAGCGAWCCSHCSSWCGEESKGLQCLLIMGCKPCAQGAKPKQKQTNKQKATKETENYQKQSY